MGLIAGTSRRDYIVPSCVPTFRLVGMLKSKQVIGVKKNNCLIFTGHLPTSSISILAIATLSRNAIKSCMYLVLAAGKGSVIPAVDDVFNAIVVVVVVVQL